MDTDRRGMPGGAGKIAHFPQSIPNLGGYTNRNIFHKEEKECRIS